MLILDGEKLIGIITDRDIVIRAVADGDDVNSSVGTYATTDVFTMSCHTDVWEAARAMADRQLRRLPLTDHQSGKLVGIVSLAWAGDPRRRRCGRAGAGRHQLG